MPSLFSLKTALREVLNGLLDELSEGILVPEERLEEDVGNTLPQVLLGSQLGFTVTVLCTTGFMLLRCGVRKTVEEIEAPAIQVPSANLFPEINVGSMSSIVHEVNEGKVGKYEAMLNEGNHEEEVVEFADTNSNNGGLQKDIFWHKDITDARSKGNQVLHFPADVIKKALRPDITSCTMMDLETGEYYDCTILKSRRKHVEMYLAEGWYSFAKNKKLKVGDKLIFHYNSEKEFCMSRCSEMMKRRKIEVQAVIYVMLCFVLHFGC